MRKYLHKCHKASYYLFNCRTDEIKGWRENKRESIQLDPIPVAAEHTSRFQLSLLDDQSTQFDIPRPASYDDHTSTPYPYQSVANGMMPYCCKTVLAKNRVKNNSRPSALLFTDNCKSVKPFIRLSNVLVNGQALVQVLDHLP